MIYYILPNFNNYMNINQKIIKNIQKNKNEKIWGIEGMFNYSSWYGGINNNHQNFQCLTDYLKLILNIHIPIRLNCANTQLNIKDYSDEHMNVILSSLEFYGNNIEITDLNLMKYIKKQYPKYNFTLSNYFFLNNTLNDIDNIKDFELIKIPYYNIDILKKIPWKEKIELIINPLCPYNCKNLNKCIIFEHLLQLNYSNYSHISKCTLNYQEQQFKNIINIEPYINIGIHHFSFNTYNLRLENEYTLFSNFLSNYFLL